MHKGEEGKVEIPKGIGDWRKIVKTEEMDDEDDLRAKHYEREKEK